MFQHLFQVNEVKRASAQKTGLGDNLKRYIFLFSASTCVGLVRRHHEARANSRARPTTETGAIVQQPWRRLAHQPKQSSDFAGDSRSRFARWRGTAVAEGAARFIHLEKHVAVRLCPIPMMSAYRTPVDRELDIIEPFVYLTAILDCAVLLEASNNQLVLLYHWPGMSVAADRAGRQTAEGMSYYVAIEAGNHTRQLRANARTLSL